MKLTITIQPGHVAHHAKVGKSDFNSFHELANFLNATGTGAEIAKLLLQATSAAEQAAEMLVEEGFKPVKAVSPESPEILAIYAQYPRKVARPAALKAIVRAIQRIKKERNVDPYEWLFDRTTEYAEVAQFTDPEYIPHPATWYNQERYNDALTPEVSKPAEHLFR